MADRTIILGAEKYIVGDVLYKGSNCTIYDVRQFAEAHSFDRLGSDDRVDVRNGYSMSRSMSRSLTRSLSRALSREGYIMKRTIRGGKSEAEICLSLPDSEFFPRIIAAGISDSCTVIVQEKCDVFDVELMVKDIRTLAYNVCQSLAFLHNHNIIHGDVKVENILWGKRKRWKLCDLGSALWIDQVADMTAEDKLEWIQTATTEAYRPPEFFDHANLTMSTKSDMWMLGCTLLTLVFKRLPYQGASFLSRATPLHLDPASRQTLGDSLAMVVESCLATRSDDRPSANECVAMLACPQQHAEASWVGFPQNW